MENHDWSSIAGNVSEAPFLNSLLSDPNVAYATNYIGVTHPSEPNYLILEAGDTFGIRNDRDPEDNGQATHDHLVSLLDHAKPPRSWRSYQEHIELHPCPIRNHGAYAVRHNPVMYFTDVTSDRKYCREHVVPMGQLAIDLRREADTPGYAFITPDIFHDMHSERKVILGMRKTTIQQGDDWLRDTIRMIRKSDAYTQGLVIVTWDESEGSRQPPIGFLMISPFVKRGAIKTHYDHYNAFRTIEALFGVGPVGNARARRAAPMSDFLEANVFPHGPQSRSRSRRNRDDSGSDREDRTDNSTKSSGLIRGQSRITRRGIESV